MMRRPVFYLAIGMAVLACVAMLTVRSRRSTWAATYSLAPVPSVITTTGPVADAAPGEETIIPPLPPNLTHVPDDYLLKLSAMVDLPNAEERRIDKVRWGRAVPIAERLAQSPCDCEQRNWLNHFVEMGNDALQGSDEDYYRLAVQMRKMARSDKQLADHVFAN